MKTKFTFLCFTFLTLVTNSCTEKNFDLDKPNVRQFVNILKDGSYFDKVGYEIPYFSMNDIGELVKYLGDTTEIKEFPTNPISSKMTSPKILNECIMWTIEGIRLDEKYPSLEPVLVDITTTSNETGYTRLTKIQLLDISEKYNNWYSEYKTNPSESLRKIDIIDTTKHKWN